MKKVDRILKMATAYEERAELESQAFVQAVIGLALLAAPFVTEFVDQLKATGDIPADVDKALGNLNSYKSSYGFGQYEAQFGTFMEASKNLKDSFTAISSSTNPADPSLLGNISKFMDSANKVQTLGYAIKGYLDSMKGTGGKVFDVVKQFKFNLGIDTAATAAADAIDALYKHISMAMPKIEASYKELSSKVQQAHQQGGLPTPGGTGTPGSSKPASQTEELADITF